MTQFDLDQIHFNSVGVIKYNDNSIPVIFIDENDKVPPDDCNGVDINSNIYYSPELKNAFVKFTIDSDQYDIHKEYYIDALKNMEFFDLLAKIWCFGIANKEKMYMVQIPKISNLELIYENLRKFKEKWEVPIND